MNRCHREFISKAAGGRFGSRYPRGIFSVAPNIRPGVAVDLDPHLLVHLGSIQFSPALRHCRHSHLRRPIGKQPPAVIQSGGRFSARRFGVDGRCRVATIFPASPYRRHGLSFCFAVFPGCQAPVAFSRCTTLLADLGAVSGRLRFARPPIAVNRHGCGFCSVAIHHACEEHEFRVRGPLLPSTMGPPGGAHYGQRIIHDSRGVPAYALSSTEVLFSSGGSGCRFRRQTSIVSSRWIYRRLGFCRYAQVRVRHF